MRLSVVEWKRTRPRSSFADARVLRVLVDDRHVEDLGLASFVAAAVAGRPLRRVSGEREDVRREDATRLGASEREALARDAILLGAAHEAAQHLLDAVDAERLLRLGY